jgi:hypothetical protein
MEMKRRNVETWQRGMELFQSSMKNSESMDMTPHADGKLAFIGKRHSGRILRSLDPSATECSCPFWTAYSQAVLPAGSSFLASKNPLEMKSITTIALPLPIPRVLHMEKMMQTAAIKKPMYTWLVAVMGSQLYLPKLRTWMRAQSILCRVSLGFWLRK